MEKKIEVTHLFLHCQDSWLLWNSFMNWLDFALCIPYSLDDLMLYWRGLARGNRQDFQSKV